MVTGQIEMCESGMHRADQDCDCRWLTQKAIDEIKANAHRRTNPADIPGAASEADDGQTEAIDGYTPPRRLNWVGFLTGPRPPIDWLPGRLLARGEQIALVGNGKVGKSLLALEWAWRSAAGLPFLDDINHEPMRVMYIDYENPEDEVRDRLIALGADEPDLANLVYLPFPPFGPLDTPPGAALFAAAVEHYNPQLVFLDTASRVISGKENDADPWLALYRLAIVPLKAAGRSLVRLDHFGKDTERGARGSSAKTQDIDHVWELTEGAGTSLQLKRTHTRTGAGEDTLNLHRYGEKGPDGRWRPGETRHTVGGKEMFVGLGVVELARRFDEHGVPRDAGRDKLRQAASVFGIKADTNLLATVARFRKEQPQ